MKGLLHPKKKEEKIKKSSPVKDFHSDKKGKGHKKKNK